MACITAAGRQRRRTCRMLLLLLVWMVVSQARRTPEASSTLLKMHRLYTMQPPHDASLYNILRVSPNATVAEITKSFRKRTRDLHPDKSRHYSNMSEEERADELQQVREAYEVLNNDATRLPYHRFGLLDTGMAAFILTGGKMGNAIPSPEQNKLLEWMGYSNPHTTHSQRLFLLAANLIERIRPLVEGAIDESTLADAVAQECDFLKKVPLGAQIIRCIGRAYRHSGQRVLRQYHRKGKSVLLHPLHVGAALSDNVRDKMRDAKQVLTAAIASGRLVFTEKMTLNGKRNAAQQLPSIAYNNMEDGLSRMDQLIGEDDVHNLDCHIQSTEDIKEQERQKAQTALLESLQVEALWKISKIDLDRTIQEACNLILTGEYFFFPSHQSSTDSGRSADGWVGQTGEIVSATIGRLRAAAALVMVGDVMVRCSKEGTAWME